MLSLVQGDAAEPLLDYTIGEALERAAATWPDQPGLIDCGQKTRFSWNELNRRATALAAGLLDLGLRPGDRLGIWSLNRWEWTVTQFATAKAGIILVTVNPAYRLAELEYALELSGCAAIIVSPPFKTSDYTGMIRTLIPELGAGDWTSARLPQLRHVILMGEKEQAGFVPFASVESRGAAALSSGLILPKIDAADPINIQFTSGTTGSPKAVTLSHGNILNNGYFVGRGIRLRSDDRICIPVPLYHCFGMVMGNLAAVTSGAAMVYPGCGFDADATLRSIADERCTALYGVPTMFIAELDSADFDKYDLSSLRTGIMAGAPCPIEVMRRVVDRMHMAEITICYGMTETSPVSFQSSPDDPLELRVSTIGQVHPHIEVKIVNEAGETVPRGEIGELCTRGYSVMRGYWRDEKHSAAVKDADGWMHSGDLAMIDDGGYAKIVGWLKDMVIRGGENLYPREIEEYLFRHSAIKDVQVFGVPDPHYGEELCALVILHEGATLDERSLQDFCRGQISHQKIPRYVRFVASFPMTVTGKVQKHLLREAMSAELGLNAAETAQ